MHRHNNRSNRHEQEKNGMAVVSLPFLVKKLFPVGKTIELNSKIFLDCQSRVFEGWMFIARILLEVCTKHRDSSLY